jgi:hypothetical protein
MDSTAFLTWTTFFLCAAFYIQNGSGSVVENPTSVTVSVNELANFNCMVCQKNVMLKWRLAIPNIGEINKNYYKSGKLQEVLGDKGIIMKNYTSASNSNDCMKVTIQICATSQMDRAIIQCAAIATRESVHSSYSSFAVLQVQPLLQNMGGQFEASNETTTALVDDTSNETTAAMTCAGSHDTTAVMEDETSRETIARSSPLPTGKIMEHPTSITVSVDTLATFSCSICRNKWSLMWKLVAPQMREMNEDYHKYRRLQNVWEDNGINIEHKTSRRNMNGCRKVVESIKIRATSQMDGAVIQCAAIATRKNVASSYSRIAVLQVQPLS